jgi:uncharacterized membrane protein YphA (DoxX/SURF4 family)
VIRPWRAWVALWDAREPPTALALVRIAVALVILVDLLEAWRLGVVAAVWAPGPDGFAPGRRLLVDALQRGPELAHGLWLAGVIAAVAMLTGTLTRVACVATALVSAQLAHLAPDSDRGIDAVLRVVSLILALSQSHARWSVDAWLRRRVGRPFPAQVPAWPRRLLFLQLLWVYFSGGHNKDFDEWGFLGHFTALGNVLGDPHFARWPALELGALYPLTQVATALTMLFELGAPAVIVLTWLDDRPGRVGRWCRGLRWSWLALLVGFHLGIAVMMRLGIFPWGMLAIAPVLLHPWELARAEGWARRMLRLQACHAETSPSTPTSRSARPSTSPRATPTAACPSARPRPEPGPR